jgi:mannose-6-phosphate isomerase
MVWGGRRLGEALGKQLPTDEPYGESWEISDHPLHRSVVASGLWAGTTLRKLMESSREELLGPGAKATTFPLLVKYLDCSDWLSVQVHPDEEAVKRLWRGEGSKTEAWFVLEAAPGSRIYAGLKPGVGERELRAALQAGTVAECLHDFEPKPGDCVFLPAGTVHAAGGGVLIAEVQQTSDATFRLFDWNRRDAQGKSRKLHIDEALASIHWDQGPVLPVHVPEFLESLNPRLRSPGAPGAAAEYPKLWHLVDCSYFEMSFARNISGPLPIDTHAGHACVLLVLTGSGVLTSRERRDSLIAGQTWLLPASLPMVDIDGSNLSALICALPVAE